MPGAVGSVIIAATQSVAKVFVIGAVGYYAVIFPRKDPILPARVVGIVARFGFNIFVLALIYSTTAVSITIDSIGDYWFVMVAAFYVIGTSYIVATLTSWSCFRIDNIADFYALRIAATFPNIVALPILIFPSLCEYQVVYEGYYTSSSSSNDTVEMSDMREQCESRSNSMIFIYFFAWSLVFYSFGHPQLLKAAKLKASITASANNGNNGSGDDLAIARGNDNDNTPNNTHRGSSFFVTLKNALIQTFSSPGFLAITAGFITGCITPLRRELFDAGGALRFIGSAVQTLGQASSPMSTMVAAASLASTGSALQQATNSTTSESSIENVNTNSNVANEKRDSKQQQRDNDSDDEGSTTDQNIQPYNNITTTTQISSHIDATRGDANKNDDIEPPSIMSDPNFGPRQRRRSSVVEFLRRHSTSPAIWKRTKTRQASQQRKLLIWFVLSRLILAPAVVVGTLTLLDCTSSVFASVPQLAKLVIIVNSSVPGALIVIVLLKCRDELADSAAAVARVYLPSYLLSIVTIAGWTALGMWLTLPDENGLAFCDRV